MTQRGSDVTTFSAAAYIGPAPGSFCNQEVYISDVGTSNLRAECHAWNDSLTNVKARASKRHHGMLCVDNEPDIYEPGGFTAHIGRAERTMVRVAASDNDYYVIYGNSCYRRVMDGVSRRVTMFNED